MAENTVKLIEGQSATIGEIYDYDTSTLYTEDVQLIAKDGKIYYLPEKNARQTLVTEKSASTNATYKN